MYIEFPTLEYTIFFHQKPNPDSSPSPAILSPTPFPPGTVIGPTRGGAADTSPRLSTQDNGFMTTVASAATSGPTAAILAISGADGGATSGGSAAAAQRGLVLLPNGGGRELVVVHDPEMSRENPVEGKYLKLIRYNRGLLDKDLKPDQKERTQLKKILNYLMTKHLTMDEKEFLWKFRYYLRTIPQALTKFMKCVDWEHKKDRKQTTKLIEEWEGIEVDDALELLSAAFKGINPVRRFAIRRLEKADDQELLSYFLQLCSLFLR
ncbi:Phosphatidylinositol (PI) 3-kinase [Balamuthia mandrillaris]